MDKEIAISVKNVSKTFKIPHEKVSSLRGAAVSVFSRKRGYEEFNALDDVSFEVKKGEFFGIIGRNGSGKSTLLKILAGIYQADKGKVKINGRISPFLELGIGFNPELSGRDNVYLNATVLGLTKKEIDEKFESIVKFSELERFIDQKLKNYSSGMQVRLAFSVSIHANRDILLMDEVLAVGDSNFQSKCLEEFNKYRDKGKTVILVSHDIATVQVYCDRALLLRDGKIISIGKARETAEIYIGKNIYDEEKKKKNDDGKAEGTEGDLSDRFSYRIGNGKASITDIEIQGNSKEGGIAISDKINILINYEASKVEGDIFLGIAIYPKARKEHVFSFEKMINSKGKKLKITMAANYLNSGIYYISAGLIDKNKNWANPYDLREKNFGFEIKAGSQKKDFTDYSICNIPFEVTYED